MNDEKFTLADEAYQRGDFASALQAFTDCLQDEENPCQPGEIGLVFHRIGNCLVKFGDYNEAIRAFTQAAADAEYDQVGAVNCNLGTSYAVLKDFENAVRFFEVAVSDARYATPYKAYMGMGNALLRLGKSAEAGAAFRSAALDNANPSPAKALLNLGVCFMALNRPADAVTSYESALQFDMDQATKNRLYANLGQAYVSNNQFQQAISAFETALADKTYYLNDAASVDYQQAIALVSTGTAVIRDLKVEPALDISGIDVPASDSPEYDDEMDRDDMPMMQEMNVINPDLDAYTEQDAAYDQSAFFATDGDDFEQWNREMSVAKKRGGGCMKVFIALLLVAILAAGAGIGAFVMGYGWPTQEAAAQAMFADPSNPDVYAEGTDEGVIKQFGNYVVETATPTINGIERGMTESTVYATVSTEDGGDVNYKISMVRDTIGWTVSNVELYFVSKN